MIILLFIFVCAVEAISRYLLYKNTPNDLIFKNNIIYSGKPYGNLFRNQLNNIGCIGDDLESFKLENEKRISPIER